MAQQINLTQPQKAAAILVAMGKPAAGRLLKFFKQEELKTLIEAARVLRTIPQADLERVVGEFESEFTEGAGLLDSADEMDTLLTENLSPEEMSLLMGRAAPPAQEGAPPVWAELERLDPERLLGILAGEHPQAIALVLTNLGSQPASRVIVALDKKLRTEVVKRMLSINAIKPAARQMIERHMRLALKVSADAKDMSAGQSRVANVLNELDKAEMDEVMRDLEESGGSDVDAIRARLFSFDDVVLLSQKARVLLFDGLATDQVTLALRDTPAELREAVLSALGQRSRRMIEAELAAAVDVSPDDVAAARKRIASSAVDLAQKGQLELPSAEKAAEAA
ncbi:MAG TPA: flagellar motor switch protein FliG [Reyranella sp.]|nr:flagellar motor switch protein FliG [Reyranella sp.]